MTDFSKRAEILGELWLDYREDENFEDFITYNDLGLPLAYLASQGLAKCEPRGELYINETWDLLLEALGIAEDTGWDSLDDLLDSNAA